MKLSVAIATPEVSPLPAMAMLSGDFAEKLAKAKAFGFAGVELMIMDPNQLNPVQMRARRSPLPGSTWHPSAAGRSPWQPG